MINILTNIKTAALLLWNKGVAILALTFLLYRYLLLATDKPTPFAELLYAGILVAAIIVVAPVVRLLVFAEAAQYAESGDLRRDLQSDQNKDGLIDSLSPGLLHYWFATLVSYGVTAMCVSSLLK